MRSSRDQLQLNHFKWNLLPCTACVRGLCTLLCRSETVTKGGTEMISWKMSWGPCVTCTCADCAYWAHEGRQSFITFLTSTCCKSIKNLWRVCQLKGTVVLMLDLPNIHILIASVDCVVDTDWLGQ